MIPGSSERQLLLQCAGGGGPQRSFPVETEFHFLKDWTLNIFKIAGPSEL